jgi:hypothetical protein
LKFVYLNFGVAHGRDILPAAREALKSLGINTGPLDLGGAYDDLLDDIFARY